MGSFIDHTGQRFGRLVVTSIAGRNGKRKILWNCVCDCGKEVVVIGECLRTGQTKSCGCYSRDRLLNQPFVNFVGMRFGRLLVVDMVEKVPNEPRFYECVCDCGKRVKVRAVTLRNGMTRSCGCLRAETTYARSIVHGLSNTKEYSNYLSKKRRDFKLLYDTFWTVEMECALTKFQPFCAICGITEEDHLQQFGQTLAVDHVLPLSLGNGLRPGNATRLCRSCNSKKCTKNINDLPIEWQADIIWSAFKFKDHWDTLQFAEIHTE